MKQILKVGTTSKRLVIKIVDTSSASGGGLTGLVFNSAGLSWYYWREDTGDAGGTSVTLATATRGTFTSGGFKEIDATNLPGYYEIGVPNAVLASGAAWAVMQLKGATNMQQIDIEIELEAVDRQDAAGFGLSRLDAAVTTRASQTSVDTIDDFLDTEIADIQTKIGTPSNLGGGATIAANLSDIEAQTDDIGTAGAGLSAVPWNAAWDAEVQSEVADALAVYDPPTHAELQSEINDVQTDVAAVLLRLQGLVMAQGTIGSTGNDATHLHLTGLTYGNDEINSCLIVIRDVSENEYHARWIEDWADTGDLVTVATLPFTPENAVDTYWLLPIRSDVTGGSGLDAAGVRAAVGLASANLDTQLTAIDDAVDTEVAAILAAVDTEVAAIKAKTDNLPATPAATGDAMTLADGAITAAKIAADAITAAKVAADVTTEVQSGLATAASIAALNNLSAAQVNSEVDTALADVGLTTTVTGRIDAAVSTRASQASLDTVDDFLDTEVAAILAAVDTEIAAIKAKTDNLPAIPAAVGSEMALADGAITAAKIATGAIDADALAADAIAEIWTTALTEAYAADGAAPTAAQALFAILQVLTESSISGTTWTVKKLDGSTSAFTLTINSATTPTSVTRSS